MAKLIMVCGAGRCGSSLMMQMLNACGLHLSGDYPGFEDNRIESGCGDWMIEYDAVKVLDPQLREFDLGERGAVVIWLDRDLDQQARSFLKMMSVFFGMSPARHAHKCLMRDIETDRKKALRKLERIGCEIIRVKFEDLLLGDVDVIAEKFGFDPDIMRSMIIERPPECLVGMLEYGLLKKAEAS